MTTNEDKQPPTINVSITGNVDGNITIGDQNAVGRGVSRGSGDPRLTTDPRPCPSPLFTIPDPPANFTGRADELDELLTNFTNGAAISGLSGGGGIGKSALARLLAQRLAAQYPDARLEIDLQGAPRSGQTPLDAAEALRRLLQPFYPTQQLPDDEAALHTLFVGTFRERRALLLLDNARDAAQVRALLPPAPSAAIVTSRAHILLNDLGLRPLRLGALRPDEARDLLRKGAPVLQSAAEAELDTLTQQCGALPLALNVAAALLAARPDWTPARLIERLQDERTRLQRLKSADDPNLDVEASLSLSYQLLSDDDRRRYRLLGVFPAPFDLPALEAIWTEPPEACDEALGRLLRLNLLDARPQQMPYELHDLARLHAEGLPRAQSDEWPAAAQRHADYFLQQGWQTNQLYEQGGEHVLESLRRFDALWPHLQAAYERSLPNAGGPLADRWLSDFPGKVAYLLNLRLPPRQHIPLLESALAAARRLKDQSYESIHLINLGLAYADLGEPRRAIECYEQSLPLKREIGDRHGEGNALGSLGLAYADLGEPRRAIEYHEQALVINRETGDRRGEGHSLGNLGNAYADLGEMSRAIELYEQSLVINREIGDKRGEGVNIGNLGIAYKNLGEPSRAMEYYEQSLVIHREIGDKQGEASDCWNMGALLVAQGEFKRAAGLMQVYVDFLRAIGHPDAEELAKHVEEVKKKMKDER
jgi:tetratricopeptide (TPR) repeat protein